jgi:transcription termination/antitermination protein NusG
MEPESQILRIYPDRRWCALHTRARHEKKVAGVCEGLKVPHYLPLYIHHTFSGGRSNTFHLPMFPGYVFSALAPGDITHLKRTNSVAQRIETTDEDGLLKDLDNVMRVEASRIELEVGGVLQAGQRVQVICGPLAGVIGVVIRYKNRTRLQISIGAIQQFILVDVKRDDLVPL